MMIAPFGHYFEARTALNAQDIIGTWRLRSWKNIASDGSERSEAMRTYLSYSGPFEVVADQGTVIHHIEVCSYPNWIGNAQVRSATLEGNMLTLRTKPMIFQGVERRAEVLWERVGHD
jgi:Lipocalin-like domain